MEYIDKSVYQDKERKIDLKYLKDCFDSDTYSFYPSIDSDESYRNFSSKEYRKGFDGWEKLLLHEQNGRCCYCMRKLRDGALNIEHVIPRNIESKDPKVEFQKYTDKASILADHVELASDFAKMQFSSSEELETVERFPHKIALANLLASCNGKFGMPNNGCCCNNARGNDYLLPLMLMPEIKDRVFYDGISGLISIYPQDPSWIKMLQTLNDDTFKEIRVLWYKIWLHKNEIQFDSFEIDDVKKRILLLKKIFEEDNFENIPNEYHKYGYHNIYWQLLMDFDWFLSYNWKR